MASVIISVIITTLALVSVGVILAENINYKEEIEDSDESETKEEEL